MPSHRRRKVRMFGAAKRRLSSSPTAQTLRHRGIYLLPNAFTTAALFCGFYAIVQAMNGRFEIAAIAIFFAMVLDGMDGRVARLTRTQSAFGEQYDSLSDMTSFGVAPALVMYEWVLSGLGRWGWMAAFVYVAGAALRLARFNTNIEVVDKRFFQGLPSPAAAALIAGFVWLAIDNKLPISDPWMPWSAFALTVYAGVTMVSNAPFFSGKAFALGRSVPFWMILLVVFGFVFVSTDPPIVLFGLFVCYGLSGYAMWVVQWRRNQRSARPGTGGGSRRFGSVRSRSGSLLRSGKGAREPVTHSNVPSEAQGLRDSAYGERMTSTNGGVSEMLHTSATSSTTSYSSQPRSRVVYAAQRPQKAAHASQELPAGSDPALNTTSAATPSNTRSVLRNVLGKRSALQRSAPPSSVNKQEPMLTEPDTAYIDPASTTDKPVGHGSIAGVYSRQHRARRAEER